MTKIGSVSQMTLYWNPWIEWKANIECYQMSRCHYIKSYLKLIKGRTGDSEIARLGDCRSYWGLMKT
mgnify:CR=1 FL=1